MSACSFVRSMERISYLPCSRRIWSRYQNWNGKSIEEFNSRGLLEKAEANATQMERTNANINEDGK